MFGGGSFQLARVFGIRIGVDWSWFIVLFLIIWSLSGYYEDVAPGSNAFVLAVVSALLFFLSILLHELGHAWVAIRNGISIEGIDLWMFGGVAKLSRDSDSPGVEFRIAAAGPLVTAVIAAVCFGLGTAMSSGSDALNSARFDQDVHRRHDCGARLPGLDQHPVACVQPDPGVPARWRAHRAGHRVEADRGPQQGHALRGQARSARRLSDDRRRCGSMGVDGRRRRRHLARLHRLVPSRRGALGRGAGGLRGSDRAHPRGRRDGPRAGGDSRGRIALCRRTRFLPALRLAVVSGDRFERQARGSRVSGGCGEHPGRSCATRSRWPR